VYQPAQQKPPTSVNNSGAGKPIDEIIASMNQVAEGV